MCLFAPESKFDKWNADIRSKNQLPTLEDATTTKPPSAEKKNQNNKTKTLLQTNSVAL